MPSISNEDKTMGKDILEIFICPECRGSSLESIDLKGNGQGRLEEGIILCRPCSARCLIENNILELIKEQVNKDRKMLFFNKHKNRLTDLGIRYQMKDGFGSPEITHKKSQMDFFDQFSGDYVMETQSFWKAYYAFMLNQFAKRIPQGSRILDLGCGTGLGTRPFLNENYTVVGIDISRGMLQKAVSRMQPGQVNKHLFFIADAEDLPFRENAFDYCIGIGILHHVHNAAKVVQGIHACLKPQGIYFGHENNKTSFRPLFDFFMRIYSLWHEKAGEEQLFSPKDIENLCSKFVVDFRTHVFLPPHFFNSLQPAAAGRILQLTDDFFSKTSFLRNGGGTIIFEARKQ